MAGGTIKKAKAGKKGRKIDRNKPWCKGYRSMRKHEKSHERRLAKHTATHPNDAYARHLLTHYRTLLGVKIAA